MKSKELINEVYKDQLKLFQDFDDPEVIEEIETIKKFENFDQLFNYLNEHGFENPYRYMIKLIIEDL